MKLIFGLGNIGPEYDGTRHNTGFFALDALAKREGVEFSHKPKFKALLAEITVDTEKVLLAKPTTLYNLAGESYRLICDFYKLEAEHTLIIHDELALPFGTVRARTAGADAGNNGIKSINQYGGSDSRRLRVGVANELRQRIGDTDFVLGRFSASERDAMQVTITPKLLEIMDQFIVGDHPNTSHKLIDPADSPL